MLFPYAPIDKSIQRETKWYLWLSYVILCLKAIETQESHHLKAICHWGRSKLFPSVACVANWLLHMPWSMKVPEVSICVPCTMYMLLNMCRSICLYYTVASTNTSCELLHLWWSISLCIGTVDGNSVFLCAAYLSILDVVVKYKTIKQNILMVK